ALRGDSGWEKSRWASLDGGQAGTAAATGHHRQPASARKDSGRARRCMAANVGRLAALVTFPSPDIGKIESPQGRPRSRTLPFPGGRRQASAPAFFFCARAGEIFLATDSTDKRRIGSRVQGFRGEGPVA